MNTKNTHVWGKLISSCFFVLLLLGSIALAQPAGASDWVSLELIELNELQEKEDDKQNLLLEVKTLKFFKNRSYPLSISGIADLYVSGFMPGLFLPDIFSPEVGSPPPEA